MRPRKGHYTYWERSVFFRAGQAPILQISEVDRVFKSDFEAGQAGIILNCQNDP